MATVRDLVTDAFYLIGVGSAEESLSNADAQLALRQYNRIQGKWSADGIGVYTEVTESFTLTPGTGSYTIGTGGTFNTTRPQQILSAHVRLNSEADYTVEVITHQRYQEIITKAVQSDEPEYLAFLPNYPLATIYLWPVPSDAVPLRLTSKKPLTAATLGTSFSAPEGYEDAIVSELAVQLAPFFGKPVTQDLYLRAQNARNTLYSAYVTIEAMQPDPFAPGLDGSSSFNWITGD